MFGDFAWIIKLIRKLHILPIPREFSLFFVRIAWGFFIIQYQSLVLFMESLTQKNFTLRPIHKISCFISGTLSFYFIENAFFSAGITNALTRYNALLSPSSTAAPLEMKMMGITVFYLSIVLILPTLIFTLRQLFTSNLPIILRKQIKIVILYFMCPYVAAEALHATQFAFPGLLTGYLYTVVALYTIFITIAISYCIRKIMGLRFLNIGKHVQSTHKTNFVNNFKELLEQLSHATNFHELEQLTQTFFKDAFDVPLQNTRFFVRADSKATSATSTTLSMHKTESLVESFLTLNSELITQYIKKKKILIYDEIEFSNFYANDPTRTSLLTFLNAINAAVFLPIYEDQKIIGYIIVDSRNGEHEFYGNVERDEMLVFARYLGSIINLLQHMNLQELIHQEKDLKEELHRKYQEINQYKESIKSFLRTSGQKEIGIIFYKNKRFIFGNQIAKDLLPININTHDGHHITKTIKQIATQVSTYKSPQTSMTTDANGQKLVLFGVPNLEQNNTIIMVYRPEISDIMARKIELLNDPTQWDYLLYLETTKSGQLINQLIPGTGELLLNFKIDLLKIALSEKAILLHMPEEDLLPTVEILHHISLKEQLHTLHLTVNMQTTSIATQLFGINPLLGQTEHAIPLLAQLNGTGTLFIRNIELLDFELQRSLADFIKYGFYQVFKSDHKIQSTVRIICSSQKDLQKLVNADAFSKELFNELNQTAISMPSLETLSEQELCTLAEGFTQQMLEKNNLDHLLALTDKEKSKLTGKRPISLHNLKARIDEIVTKKSKKHTIYHETQFDPSYEMSDPKLIAAAQLGKKTLRDQHLMHALWEKFKNQNQIATFLGVNRSSVNRRCKEYGFE